MDKLSSSLWTSYLSYDVCFVSKDMCVEMEAMRDRVDMSMRTDSKETRIHKPPSPFFTKETIGHTPRVLMQGRKKTDSY
jgi:hypothetical protein